MLTKIILPFALLILLSIVHCEKESGFITWVTNVQFSAIPTRYYYQQPGAEFALNCKQQLDNSIRCFASLNNNETVMITLPSVDTYLSSTEQMIFDPEFSSVIDGFLERNLWDLYKLVTSLTKSIDNYISLHESTFINLYYQFRRDVLDFAVYRLDKYDLDDAIRVLPDVTPSSPSSSHS